MKKIFTFQSSEPFDHDVFNGLIGELIPGTEVFYEDNKSGSFLADSIFASIIENNIYAIHQALNVRINILITHRFGELTDYCRRSVLDYFPNQCVNISDFLFKRTSFGDFYYIHYLKSEFDDVPEEILETVGAFLRCGLNGIETARMLGIHRNTFNYRLNEFIKKTDCDIRDYHNAVLLELYFQFVKRH
ncbi:MAG: helix-turn-helix domain-containing protein [Bacilli bacterium]|nr:helix-turn-helix domain-containing protein [Bacilli bacterium]